MTTPLRAIAAITGKHKLTKALDVFYVSDRPLNTLPDDPTLPNQHFVVCLDQPCNDSRAIFTPGSTQGSSRINRSPLVLSNMDKNRYAMLDYVFAGYPVEVRIGPESSTRYDDHEIIATGVCEVPKVTEATWEVMVRDARDLLSKPLQKHVYSGVGPLEGEGTALVGKEKRLQFGGPSLHVTLPCIDPIKSIYQGHDGTLLVMANVRDHGIPLVFNIDYASEADLLNDALEPPTGKYNTYLAGGMLRTHGDNEGDITADLTEGATLADRSAARVAQRMHYLAGYDPSGLQISDFDALHAANPAPVELHIDDARTGLVAVDAILGTVGAGSWPTPLGIVRVARLELPSGDADLTLRESQMEKGTISLEPAADAERGLPAYLVRTNYAKNYTPTSDLSAGVSQVDRAFFAQATSRAVYENADVLDLYPNAVALELETCFVNEGDAFAEATRIGMMRRIELPRFQITVVLTMARLPIDLNAIAGVIHSGFLLPLIGDDIGRRERVLGIALNAKTRRLTYTVWGNDLTSRNIAARSGHLLRARNGDYLITRSAA